MSNLCCLPPRMRLVVLVERVVVAGLGLVLYVQVDRPREQVRSLLPRWLPATAEVPVLLTRMMRLLLLVALPVAAMVVVLLAALAQEEVLQEVLLQVVPHHLDSALARLHVHQDRHLGVLALLVDGLLDGVPGAQVEVAPPVHCLGVVFLPIDTRLVPSYAQCGSVVSEGPWHTQGMSTPVQSLLVVRLSTGSLVRVCAHVGTCLHVVCSLCK